MALAEDDVIDEDLAIKQAEAMVSVLREVDRIEHGWVEGQLRAYGLQVRDAGNADAAEAILSLTEDVFAKG